MKRYKTIPIRNLSLLILPTIAMILGFSQCGPKSNQDFISSAVMESQTFQVATTVQGMITAIYKDEGHPVAQNELVAIIDTTPYLFKRDLASSGIAELGSSIAAKKGEIAAQESDVAGLEREFKRVGDMVDKGSLPSQQKDNLETQLQSARARIGASRALLASLYQKSTGLDVQLAEVNDMIRRCHVLAPAGGTVLTRYKNNGEVVLPGNPIMELGRLDTMQVDFYVTQSMVPQFGPGHAVRIRVDNSETGNTGTFIPATISWISTEAEFSPKNIQTRESRNELVFKIRAVAQNRDALLKRGLPVEIWK